MAKTPVAIRACSSYVTDILVQHFREMYMLCGGPSLEGKSVLLKPNILIDALPSRAVTTHPVFLEAAIRFVRKAGATRIMVGDSPAMHGNAFRPEASGIWQVCEKTGAEWQYFGRDTDSRKIGRHSVPIAAAYGQADVFISLPKLKTHGLMMFTGALKNTFGLIPALHKARQHALFSTQQTFAEFLWQLNETCPPDFVFMDAITGMHGPGPSNGTPIQIGAVLASASPLAVDLVAARICGYRTEEVPLNVWGLAHHSQLHSWDDLQTDGPDWKTFVRPDFKRIRQVGIRNIMVRFIIDRLPAIRRLDRRPIFREDRCIGCRKCIAICPAQALRPHPERKHRILIRDRQCIRCFCCHEVCPQNAIEIKRKIF